MTEPDLPGAVAGRSVLITGGLGFLGSHLARALDELGAHVTVLDALVPEQGGRRENVARIEDSICVELGDLRDSALVERLVGGTELIFNLAGQTSHLDSMRDPFTDLEYNCRSQLSLLEACRRVDSSPKVVFASSRQLYGRPHYLPVDESHPVAPVDVNGIHKSAGEQYHLLYAAVYGLRVTVLRLTNTFGPRMRVSDARQTFLGDWIRRVILGQEIVVLGDGSQRRDFTYADDAVRAFLLVAASTATDGEVYNLGDRRSVSLRELAELLIEINGGGAFRLEPFPEDRKAIDIGDYYADFGKLSQAVGWEPQVSLEDGLCNTLEFFREHGPAYWDSAAP